MCKQEMKITWVMVAIHRDTEKGLDLKYLEGEICDSLISWVCIVKEIDGQNELVLPGE